MNVRKRLSDKEVSFLKLDLKTYNGRGNPKYTLSQDEWKLILEKREGSTKDAYSKILIYDIETSQAVFKLWWTGKRYVGHDRMIKDPKIITIAYKWLGEDTVTHLTWSKKHSDKKMMKKFLKVYNSATMVVGQNNDNFDNRWINARAMKYNFDVNMHIKSYDLMKFNKKSFRLPSYSMAYVSKYIGKEGKLEHEGIKMWDMIEDGNKAEQKEYMQKMIDYNVQDIIATEDMYVVLRKYHGHILHFGVLNGEAKYTCPNCGTSNVKLYKTQVTKAGTVQRIMKCKKDKVQYKLSNRIYMDFIKFKTGSGV